MSKERPIGVLLAGLLIAAAGCQRCSRAILCHTEITAQRSEPSVGRKAVVTLLNCGATTGYVVDVALTRGWFLHDRIFEADASHTEAELDVDGYWDSPRALTVYFDRRLRVTTSESHSGEVRISHVPCDVLALAQAESPDGEGRASSYWYGCGDRSFTRVRVETRALEQTVFVALDRSSSDLRLHWEGNDRLVVEYHAPTRVIDAIEKLGTVTITYRAL